MIAYFIEVFKFMKKYPYKKKNGGKFTTWIRNAFYLNWQRPAKWNCDVYLIYRAIKRRALFW